MPFRIEFEQIEVPLKGGVVSVRGADDSDVDRWRRTWEPELVRAATDDASWDWFAYISRGSSSDGFLVLSALAGDQLEGLLSLSIGRSRITAGADLVYVEHIASAPWNREGLTASPRITGLGRLLMRTSVRLSEVLGHEGRIGLHSKPDTESFYRDKLGIQDFGREVVEDGEWVYFEATPEVARRML